MKKVVMLFLVISGLSYCGGGGGGGGNPSNPAPGAVTMTHAAMNTTSFTLEWEDPADIDLASIRIDFKDDSLSDYTSEPVNPDVQTWTKNVPDCGSGHRFTFVVTTIDGGGKETAVSFKVTLTADLKDYYFIYTAADLNALRGGDTTDAKYAVWDTTADGFVLMADLSLSGYNTGEGWVPIGDYNTTDTSFSKIFEGNGHVISSLVIDRPGGNYQGLFGYIAAIGVVRDLEIRGSTSGENNCGLLAGFNYGLIDNSHSSGDVTGTSTVEANSGGLAGYNNGTISNSYSSANVTVDAPNGGAGGLVGLNNSGTISGSHASGTVTGGTGYCAAGGLAAYNQDGGSITGSYATGNVSGENSVGGLVGSMPTGTVSNSYATGNVNGTGSSIGGLVGSTSDSTITTCYYSTGVVTGPSDKNPVGGLVGSMSGTSITGSYVTGNVNGSERTGGLVGYFFSGTVTNCYATGAVTGSYGVGGLFGFMDGGTASNCYATGNVTTSFDRAGGLAGINDGGTISSSYATGSVEAANNHAGGLVGINVSGSISGCHASGAVTGGTDVGGLVGENVGSISLSYSTGAVTGSYSEIGGFVGIVSGGTISNCYARGSVRGNESIGGLVGYLDAGTVSYCYSTGAVVLTGTSFACGLVGYYNVSPSGCFYDKVASGGWDENIPNTAKTTAEMQTQVTFSGWTFTGTWSIDTNSADGLVNNGYPYLTNNAPAN